MSMERSKQQQTVAINRGLFLFRYAAADEARPPRVLVTPDPASAKDISFFLHPDHKEAVLWQPETCLVVRALAAGRLSVQVIPAHEGGSVAATVRIEPLSQGKAVSAFAKKRSSLPSSRGNVSILGHVTGIGDVVVDANEWIAGPSAPSRIEGISIEWPGKPQDLEIHYAVKTAKPQTNSGRKMSLGSFAGTRGKSMPIVSLMLEMSGPGAADSQFSVEAIFLGAPAKLITGQRIVVSGPTGREPLVGLRIGIGKAAAAARPQKRSTADKAVRSEGRVRVFRSHPKQNQPATL
jgi:hypothetical protein